MNRHLPWILVAAPAFGAALSAQSDDALGSVVGGERFRAFEVWREPPKLPNTGEASGGSARVRSPGLGVELFELEERPGLGARLGGQPPPVSREALEGSGEGLHAAEELPGGIVLGLEARAGAELEGALAGARIERDAEGRLRLRLVDGRTLRCPALAPATLAALLAFTAERAEALVDLSGGFGRTPRLAPAFAGSGLEALLVQMDGLPHDAYPETRALKSLIVDRAVRFAARGEELELAADLEVRFFAGETGLARRARTLVASGHDLVGPRVVDDLSAELAPLAELAAWLGFLRRVERLDSAGIAALRAELAPASAR